MPNLVFLLGIVLIHQTLFLVFDDSICREHAFPALPTLGVVHNDRINVHNLLLTDMNELCCSWKTLIRFFKL